MPSDMSAMVCATNQQVMLREYGGLDSGPDKGGFQEARRGPEVELNAWFASYSRSTL